MIAFSTETIFVSNVVDGVGATIEYIWEWSTGYECLIFGTNVLQLTSFMFSYTIACLKAKENKKKNIIFN